MSDPSDRPPPSAGDPLAPPDAVGGVPDAAAALLRRRPTRGLRAGARVADPAGRRRRAGRRGGACRLARRDGARNRRCGSRSRSGWRSVESSTQAIGQGADAARDRSARRAGEDHAARSANRRIASAAGGARGAVPRSRAVARRDRAHRDRAGAARRQPAAAARRQRRIGARRAAARRRQAAAARPAAVPAAAARADARHGSPEGDAVRRRRRDEPQARPGDRRRGRAAARDGRAPAAAGAGQERAAPADESPWRRFLREAWADIRQLVRDRGRRSTCRAAAGAVAAILPARESQAAPPHGAHRAARRDDASFRRTWRRPRRGSSSISTRARSPRRRCWPR